MIKTINQIDLSALIREESTSQYDALLPSQFFSERTVGREPFPRLMCAVIIDAIRCYQSTCDGRSNSRRKEFDELERWFFQNLNQGPFSFEIICEALQIDPNRIRRGLLHWKQKRLTGERVKRIKRVRVSRAMRVVERRSH